VSKLLRIVATVVAMLAGANCAYAQKQGGILKLHTLDSPASMSIHAVLGRNSL
jgi:hypothetical protein